MILISEVVSCAVSFDWRWEDAAYIAVTILCTNINALTCRLKKHQRTRAKDNFEEQ